MILIDGKHITDYPIEVYKLRRYIEEAERN